MIDTQIAALLSGTLLQKVLNNIPLSNFDFNVLVAGLTAQNIPFDTSFSPGTRKAAASIQFTIHINPSASFVFVISLEQGSNSFSPSP